MTAATSAEQGRVRRNVLSKNEAAKHEDFIYLCRWFSWKRLLLASWVHTGSQAVFCLVGSSFSGWRVTTDSSTLSCGVFLSNNNLIFHNY